MPSHEAAVAANRFGLGARPGELERIGRNPKAWLARQLFPSTALPPEPGGLPHSSDNVRFFFVAKQMMRQAKKNKDKSRRKMMRKKIRQAFRKEAAAPATAGSIGPSGRWAANQASPSRSGAGCL